MNLLMVMAVSNGMIGSRNNSTSNSNEGIALDEKFTYTIKVVNNQLAVTITREGKTDVVKTVNMYSSVFLFNLSV